MTVGPATVRSAVFISHANPEDNVFATWLGAKLAALGYEVWADVLRLRGGQDWQRRLEEAIRHRACKVLLVGTPHGATKQGVRNEIQIAHDVGRGLNDNDFIIPLRLAKFDAPFLIAHAQYIDFEHGWSRGLAELMDTLENVYRVSRASHGDARHWEEIQTIHARTVVRQPEKLTSNWLAMRHVPKKIKYYEFGANAPREEAELKFAASPWPTVSLHNGFLSFASTDELSSHFGQGIPIRLVAERRSESFLDDGWPEQSIERLDARNRFTDLSRQALESFFHAQNLDSYALADGRLAWWVPKQIGPSGKVRFKWGPINGLRQISGFSAKRNVYWHFGVSAAARVSPVRHVRITSRLVFTSDGKKPLDDPGRMHRMRRSFAKSWRNPRWRDMLLAFLHWLAKGKDELLIPIGSSDVLMLRLPPIQFVAPVSIPPTEDRGVIDEDDPSEDESEIEAVDSDEDDSDPDV